MTNVNSELEQMRRAFSPYWHQALMSPELGVIFSMFRAQLEADCVTLLFNPTV